MTLRKRVFENIEGKGENAVTGIFSFFQNVYCPSKYKFQFLRHIYFVVCKGDWKCFSVWAGQKFCLLLKFFKVHDQF